MLHISAAAPAVPRPSLATTAHVRAMDDRKRSASEQDDASLPPAKRQATLLMNGDDVAMESGNSNVKFGPAGSPWAVDLAVS